MYAHSASFRLRIVAIDGSGKARSIAASALAAAAEQDLKTALAGGEAFRHARQGQALRSYLPRLAELACRVSRAARVVLTLEVKPDLDAKAQSHAQAAQCAGFQARK